MDLHKSWAYLQQSQTNKHRMFSILIKISFGRLRWDWIRFAEKSKVGSFFVKLYLYNWSVKRSVDKALIDDKNDK